MLDVGRDTMGHDSTDGGADLLPLPGRWHALSEYPTPPKPGR